MNMIDDNKKIGGFGVSSDTGVEFQDERLQPRYEPETPRVIQWVMRYSGGLVQDEKQASYVLIGFVILAIIISIFLFFGSRTEIAPPPPTPFQEGNL